MKAKLTNRSVEALQPADKRYDVVDVETPGLMVRVETSGIRTFYYRYRLANGKRCMVKIGNATMITVAQARERCAEHYSDIVKGDDPAQVRRDNLADLTLGKFLDEHYAPWCETHHKNKDTVQRLRAIFTPFMTKRLTELTRWQIEKHLLMLRKIGTSIKKKPLCAASANRYLTTLRGALSRAVQWKMLAANPLDGVKNAKVDSASKTRYLAPDELERLMGALDAWEQRSSAARHIRPMVMLSMHTGLRRGELLSLTWEDVALDRNDPFLTVRGATAKSGRTRHIPLNETAVDTLIRWRQETSATGLVFKSTRTGGRFASIKEAFQRLLQEARIDNFRWHDMRHHFASMLVQRGVDLNTVRELLGHADLSMTLRYSHLAPQNKIAAVALLDAPANVVPFAKAEGET